MMPGCHVMPSCSTPMVALPYVALPGSIEEFGDVISAFEVS
jgi:hypothetical protein